MENRAKESSFNSAFSFCLVYIFVNRDYIHYLSRKLISCTYFVTLKQLLPLTITSSQTFDTIEMSINAMFKPQVFEEDALSWEDKLNRIMALFDVWIDVQRRWVYLEGIFTGSADIKHLLPVETQRFQR